MVDLVEKKGTPLPEGRMPRDELIKQITAKERAERDGTDLEPDPEPIENEVEEEADELTPNAEDVTPRDDEVDEDELVPDDEGEEEAEDFVTVKIDGEEKKVERDQILEAGVRTFQKESAADKRLQAASEQLKKLQQYEYELRQREEALAKALPSQQDEQTREQSENDRQVYRKTAEALYSGDEDAAAEALEKLLEGRGSNEPAAPQVDTNQLVQEAVRQTRLEMQIESARESFVSEFSEIVSDPVLTRLADEESAQLLNSNPEYTPKQNLMEAGRRVREWVEAHGGGKHEPAPESNKTERKRAIKPVKAAGGKVPGKPEEKPKTRSDIVAEMRKQRGLPD
jgi:hypothetical protein